MLMILGSVLLLAAAILAAAAARPDTFRIERSIRIKAPPEKIFPLIDDLHSMATWSPWEKLDPAMKRTYSGADSGKGATYAWEGNSKAGSGRMEITESTPPAKVVLKLDFIKPFEARNMVEFALLAQGDFTVVTHAMFGPLPFMSKLMQVFLDMDRMVGAKFEEGLAELKVLAEK